MSKQTVRVQRTTTEEADIEVEIDDVEFAEWTDRSTDKAIRDFIEADRDFPESIEPLIDAIRRWKSADVEIKLVAR